MKDTGKTKEKLIEELTALRQRLAEIEASVEERTEDLKKANKQLQKDVNNRVLAEKKLEESEQKYRSVFGNTGTATVIIEEDSTISMANTEFEKLSGYSKAEIEGKMKWARFFVKEDLERMKNYHIERRKEKGEAPTEYEVRFVDKQGGIKDILNKVTMIPGTRKRVASLTDITERKQAEEALREKSKQAQQLADELELIIDGIPGLIFYKDTENRFIRVNKYVADAHKMTKKQLEGASCFKLYPRETAQAYFEDDMQVIRSRQPKLNIDEPWETELGTRWVNTSKIPYVNEKGEVTGLIGLSTDVTERKKAEDALRESKELDNALFEYNPIQTVVVDTEGKITRVNLAKKHSDDRQPAIGDAMYEDYAEKHEINMRAELMECLKSSESKHFPEMKYREKTLSITITPFYKGAIISSVDITEQKQVEELLRESEEKFRLLSEQNLLGIVILQDGLVKYVNKAASEITEYSIKEALKWEAGEYAKLFHPDDLEFVMKHAQKKQAGDKDVTTHYSYRIKTKSGNVKWVDQYSKTITFEGKNADFITIIDITEQKWLEEALETERLRLKEYFENLPLLAFNITFDGKIGDINNVALKRLGYDSKDELIGKPLNSTVYAPSSQEKAERLLEKWKREKMLKNEELQIVTKQGEIIDVLLNVDTIFDPDGKPLFSISTQLEITERKRTEKEILRVQEALRSLTDHLQNIREDERASIAREIHDEMGQALTGLKMDLSWLAKKVPRDREELLEKIRTMSGLISTTHKTVQRITTELRPGLLDDLGLAAAVEWQTEEFQSRTGIACKLSVDPEDIVIDEKRSIPLFRILQESLTNVSRHAWATSVTVSLKEKDGQIALRVRDNGKGITEEQLSSNTSFGIMGIRERVHQLHGKVRISGSPGKGTTVMVEMPIKD